MREYEYRVGPQKFRCRASDKLTAYCAMTLHQNRAPHLVLIVAPEESKDDNWFTPGGDAGGLDFIERINMTFGGPGRFNEYFTTHKPQIIACMQTIELITDKLA